MLIDFLAIPTDALVTAIRISALEAAAEFPLMRALVKIITCLLVIGQLQAVGTRASIAAFGVVARVTALMLTMLAFIKVHTFFGLLNEAAGA